MVDRNKFHLSEKIHFDQSQPFGSYSNGSDKLEGDYLHDNDIIAYLTSCDIGSVVPGELGRVHFESRFSSSKDFRPSCKMVPHVDRCRDDVQQPHRGPQLHTLKFTSYGKYRDRRHLTEKDAISQESKLSSCGKRMVSDEHNKLVSQYRSNEFQLENTIARKHRVSSDESRRNGIPIAKKGDKPYDTPERSVGFFSHGGLISGSTIHARSGKPSKGRKEEQDTVQNSKSLRSLTAHERRENEISETDKQQVEILTV